LRCRYSAPAFQSKIEIPKSKMIITRSPLRVSLGGGGTDLPSYYREFGGFLVAAAIDKYVYITLHQTFVADLIVKYSKLERVADATQLEHPIIREAFKHVGMSGRSLELTSMADIPAGTGLGSSGSFTTALLKALHTSQKNLVFPADLAEEACTIEIDRLGEPIGKQDQYIAAIGGITAFTFNKDGRVESRPVRLSEETLYNLEDNLLLFFTGYSRSASSILKDQKVRSEKNDQTMLDNLHFTKDLGYQSLAALETGNLAEFAHLMDVHWQRKTASRLARAGPAGGALPLRLRRHQGRHAKLIRKNARLGRMRDRQERETREPQTNFI
jgi:D-glycero-alpha-D-manno-heptose-7-phosphate kinase